MSYVIFDNVRKVYKAGEVEIEALRGASFTIEKGETAVIVGKRMLDFFPYIW